MTLYLGYRKPKFSGRLFSLKRFYQLQTELIPLSHKNFRLFWKLFVSSYEESSHEEFEISSFPNLCHSYLNKV